MLTTVLFDMGGTLEDIWYNKETQQEAARKLLEILRDHGLDPGCPQEVFWEKLFSGVKAYKQWSEGNMLEKKPEEIALALGRPVKTVHTQIARARQILRSQLERREDDGTVS